MKITPTGALMHQAHARPKSAAFVFHEEIWTYERLAAEAERLARGLAAHAAYEPAVLINTSGTTGRPKFVIHTPATLSESLDLMIEHWAASNDDVMILPLPMAHMSGLISFLAYIQFGVPFILLEGFDA